LHVTFLHNLANQHTNRQTNTGVSCNLPGWGNKAATWLTWQWVNYRTECAATDFCYDLSCCRCSHDC